MPNEILLNQTIEAIWETLPPTWGRIRSQIRAAAMRDHGLNLLQFHILRHMRWGYNTVAALAEHQQVSRPAVSQAIEGLVQRHLVARDTSTEDRRVVHLSLTPDGEALLAEAYAQSQHWLADQIAALKPEELDTLIAAMGLFKTAFEIPPSKVEPNS